MTEKPRKVAGCVLVFTDEHGHIVAHAADFERSAPGGFTLLEGQRHRARRALAFAVCNAYASPMLVRGLDALRLRAHRPQAVSGSRLQGSGNRHRPRPRDLARGRHPFGRAGIPGVRIPSTAVLRSAGAAARIRRSRRQRRKGERAAATETRSRRGWDTGTDQ